MKKHLKVLVGPPGSGKSTLAHSLVKEGYHRINQDDQGKDHLTTFNTLLEVAEHNIVVDRMGFNKEQRERYINPARKAGYEVEIIVLHESYETCLNRCLKREFHPTVKTEEDARNALNTFFTKYERPTEDEADIIQFIYPDNKVKLNIIWCDLDGTMCNTNHRQHFLKDSKKNWKGFFDAMDKDPLNKWCKAIVNNLRTSNIIVLASGRPDNYKEVTKKWLEDNKVFYDHLFMRALNDSRRDDIVKEIILDFEVLSRGSVLFAIDDRKQVVDMLRKRGVTVLQCDEGNF
jgi:predicted kinase